MKAMTHIYNYNRRVIVNIYSKTDCDWLTVWFDTLKTMWNNLIFVCSFRAEVRGTSGEIGRESHITTEAVVQAVAGTRRAAPQRPETIGGLISNWGEAARGSFQSHFHRFHMPFFSFSSWFCLTLCHTGEKISQIFNWFFLSATHGKIDQNYFHSVSHTIVVSPSGKIFFLNLQFP